MWSHDCDKCEAEVTETRPLSCNDDESSCSRHVPVCEPLRCSRAGEASRENYLLAPELGLNLLATVGVVVVVVVVEE